MGGREAWLVPSRLQLALAGGAALLLISVAEATERGE